ncbi:MAG: DUF3634 family protein [Myxococcales bacterium]|nr:DUF3634 family protein [Polyangiaceae bacterium]MDW8250931.1 DUF3634 family protein [Myxococcales bacterium]
MESTNLLLLLLLVATLVLPFLVLLSRANELFTLDVTQGKVSVVRGKVPPSLLRDACDVLRHVERATITARMENGRPIVRAKGLSEAQLQRMRNVVGRFSKTSMSRR